MRRPTCCSTGKEMFFMLSHMQLYLYFTGLVFFSLYLEKVARSRWGRGRRWWLWPTWKSPACCSSTSPGNGSTSSTPLPNQDQSATTYFCVSMEVCAHCGFERSHSGLFNTWVNAHCLHQRETLCTGRTDVGQVWQTPMFVFVVGVLNHLNGF